MACMLQVVKHDLHSTDMNQVDKYTDCKLSSRKIKNAKQFLKIVIYCVTTSITKTLLNNSFEKAGSILFVL